MPASFSELLGNRKRLTIDKADGTSGIFVDYRPQSLTPRKMHELLALEQTARNAQAEGRSEAIMQATDDITRQLANMLIDWDLTDDEGAPVPPTLAGLQDVDYDIQLMILSKIREDGRMGEANARPSLAPSGSTSSPTVKRATSRHHSRSSSR